MTTTSLPQVADALTEVFTTVPARRARSSGFTKRPSKITAVIFVQAVVAAWLDRPAATYRALRQSFGALGVTLSGPGLFQRFTEEAATVLRGVVEAAARQVICGPPTTLPILHRFSAVVAIERTQRRLPACLETVWRGCGGTADGTKAGLKSHRRLTWRRGRCMP